MKPRRPRAAIAAAIGASATMTAALLAKDLGSGDRVASASSLILGILGVSIALFGMGASHLGMLHRRQPPTGTGRLDNGTTIIVPSGRARRKAPHRAGLSASVKVLEAPSTKRSTALPYRKSASSRLKRRPYRHGESNWLGIATAAGCFASVLLVMLSLFYTYTIAREQQDLSAKYRERTFAAEDAERFGYAIDQIGRVGDENMPARLQGIHILENFMMNSPALAPTVVAVLSAFIRTGATRPDRLPSDVPASPPDIRAAVQVLAYRNVPPNVQDLPRVDLSGSLLGLQYVTLPGSNLARFDLSGADLSAADLTGTNLSGSRLAAADLSDARLRDADLRGAFLTNAELQGADLSGADLTGAFLTSEQLRSAEVDARTRLPVGVVVPSPPP